MVVGYNYQGNILTSIFPYFLWKASQKASRRRENYAYKGKLKISKRILAVTKVKGRGKG